MSRKTLKGFIDLTKIPKDLIRSTNKNGEPYKNNAKYLEIVVFVGEEEDQFGNVASIKVNTPQGDERKIYLGNLRLVTPKKAPDGNKEVAQVTIIEEEHNDLPF